MMHKRKIIVHIATIFITVVPTFIGEGIPLIGPRHLDVPLRLRSAESFPDGVVQHHYDVLRRRAPQAS